MKDTYAGAIIDKFTGLNSGPESSLQEGECSVLDNYLVTDEFKLEGVPGNAVLSPMSTGTKQYVKDGTNVEMTDLISHYRHSSGTKSLVLRYGGSLAVYDKGCATEGGKRVDWRRVALPTGVLLDADAGYTSWESYQKNIYMAEGGVVLYYDFATGVLADLNAENLAYYTSIGGTAPAYTPIRFNDIANHKNRLFAAVRADFPNIVAFTQPFKNKFYDIIGGVPKLQFVSVGGTDENTGDLGDAITKIIPMGDNVVVYKNNSISIITGTGLLTYRPVVITTKIGSSAAGSVQATKIGIIALHNPQSGIYLMAGGLPQEISGAVRKEVSYIKGMDRCASGVWKEKYYFLSYQDARKSGGSNNTTLVMNLSNMKWSKFDFGFQSFTDWFQPEAPRFTMIKNDLVSIFGVGAKNQANEDFSGGTIINRRFKTKGFDAGDSRIKKRWRGVVLTFRTTDKALSVKFDIDGRYESTRMVKTNPYPLWDRVKWNAFKWADERLMTKEVQTPPFTKGFRMAVEVSNTGVGQDYIESIAPVFVPSMDSKGGKR